MNWLLVAATQLSENLHEVNVHKITEHIVLFVKNLILSWQVNVRMEQQTR